MKIFTRTFFFSLLPLLVITGLSAQTENDVSGIFFLLGGAD